MSYIWNTDNPKLKEILDEQMSTNENGFSFVELAISLAILSIITITAVAILTTAAAQIEERINGVAAEQAANPNTTYLITIK